jgi:hypothetical protein
VCHDRINNVRFFSHEFRFAYFQRIVGIQRLRRLAQRACESPNREKQQSWIRTRKRSFQVAMYSIRTASLIWQRNIRSTETQQSRIGSSKRAKFVREYLRAASLRFRSLRQRNRVVTIVVDDKTTHARSPKSQTFVGPMSSVVRGVSNDASLCAFAPKRPAPDIGHNKPVHVRSTN